MLEIKNNISLRDKNWFKIGGDAKFYCEPKNIEEFKEALTYVKENNLDMFVLGLGANVLISDEGFDGLVIHPMLKDIKILPQDDEFSLVQAGAGVTIKELINYCLDQNLVDLEEFSGIPATIGGATFINLHYYDHSLYDFLEKAEIIDKETLEVKEVNKDWFEFGYDKSKLQDKKYFLISGTFKLKKVDDLMAAYCKGRRDEIIRHREKRYPAYNTCGSFFRNFFPDEVTLESNGKKLIYIAYYLDKVGVKGNLKVGDAIVSYQHSNMIVNNGNATSKDVIGLARKMQGLVKELFNIIPKPECILVGFKEYPLLK